MDKRMRVLVVDDESALLEKLGKVIDRLGHDFDVASNGQEALDKLAANEFDLVLSDICMDTMDGMTLLRNVRSMPNGGPPVAMMTGHRDVDTAQEALRLKAVDYLLKPFGMGELRTLIDRVANATFDDGKAPAEWADVSEHLNMMVPAKPELQQHVISKIRSFIRPMLEARGLDVNGITIAVAEAVKNAFQHGALNSERGTDGHVSIAVRVDEEEGLRIRVNDEGPGFNADDLPDLDGSDMKELFGDAHGIQLIRMHMDEVNWNDQGNEIFLVKYLRQVEGSPFG